MANMQRHFGSIEARCAPQSGQAAIWAGDVLLHVVSSADHARQLRRFWFAQRAPSSDAIREALDWCEIWMEGAW